MSRRIVSFPTLRSLALRLMLFALLWGVLTDGGVDAHAFGSVIILAATALSLALSRPTPWSLIGLLRFVPFFLWQSLRGGLDVAWRAFLPGPPIAPVMLTYRLRLPPGRARAFMVAVNNLLPGTLSAEISRNCLMVHVLDQRRSTGNALAALEVRIAAIFQIKLTSAATAPGQSRIHAEA